VLYTGGEEVDNNSLLCTDKEFAEMYQRNKDMVYRMCFLYLKNTADAEDATQSIFLKVIDTRKVFNELEHEKAWFITTAKNYCRDILKSWWKNRRVDLDVLLETAHWDDTESGEVLAKIFLLPEKYKTVMYLFYVEDYSIKEIAAILNRKETTVQTQLSRGRRRLKIDLGGKYNG
jgi:RNA polymerase sigma-70 factor (ECF subfamily)